MNNYPTIYIPCIQKPLFPLYIPKYLLNLSPEFMGYSGAFLYSFSPSIPTSYEFLPMVRIQAASMMLGANCEPATRHSWKSSSRGKLTSGKLT